MTDEDLAPERPARTVGQLRAALADLPEDMPILIEGEGLLEAVLRGDAGAGEAKVRTGFLDDPDAHRVGVLWLLGEARAL